MEIKGIIKDPEETERINKSFLDCKNILLDKGFTSIINEKGFEEKVLFSESERILGIVPTNKYIIVFVYISDALRIYKVDESFIKTNILTTEYLNCTGNYLIQGLFKQNYKGDTIVVFWEDNYEDCINPCIINIDNIGVDLTANKELADPVKIERLKLFPNQKVPNLEVLDKISGGNIQTGNYQIAIAYELDGERLNYLNITNPFTISNTSYNKGVHPDGAPSISMFCSIKSNTSYTGYAVPIKITNIDTNFDNIVISVIQKTNDITICKLLGKIKVTDLSEYTYIFKGDDQNTVTQSIEEITVDSLNINKFRSATSFNGRLYISNFNIDNKIDFQKYANNIKVGLNLVNIMDVDAQSKYFGVVRYDNLEYETKYKTFRPGEVYAFYIHLILNNGYVTDGYNIPGNLEYDNTDITISSACTELNNKSLRKIISGMGRYDYGTFVYDNDIPNDRYFKHDLNLASFTNTNEIYNQYFKDTELDIYDNTGKIGTLDNLNVKHHMFPNNIEDMIGRFDTNHFCYYSPMAFGINIKDIYIPDDIKSQIQGYYISYAERNSTNSLVAFSGLKCEDMNIMYNNNGTSTYGHFPLNIPAIASNTRKPIAAQAYPNWSKYASNLPGTRIYDYVSIFNKSIPNFLYDYELFNITFERDLTFRSVEPKSSLLFLPRYAEDFSGLPYIQRTLNFITNDTPIIVPINSNLENYPNLLRELYIATYQYTDKGVNNNPASMEIKINNGDYCGQLKYPMDNIYPVLAELDGSNQYSNIVNMSIRNFKRYLENCYLNFKTQTLIRCSDIIDKNITIIPFIMNGDTYINKELSRQRIAKYEESSQFTDYDAIDIAYINYSSLSNVHQTDDYFIEIPNYKSDTGTEPQLFPKYENNNITYSTKAKLKIPKPNDNELYTNEFKYSIIRSIAQGNETLIEKWRTFKDTDLHTFFTNKGELEYINSNDRIMYIHYHNSLYKAVIKDTIDSNSVSVGIIQGEIFDRIPEEIQSGDNTFIFSRYINQSLFTKYGYFHIDIDNNKIYLLSDSVNDLTKFKITNDIKNDFNIVLNRIKQGDKSLVFSSINFDEENDRVLFNYNFHNGNKSQCLSYYPIVDSFVSKHDYKASKLFSFLNKSYCISDNTIIGNNLGTQNNGIYKLNSGIYGKYCDTNIIYNSYIIFLLKSKNSIDEIFESIKYNKNKDNNFDNCIVFSKDQCSDNININVSGDWYDMSAGRTLLDEHIINNFRDIATNSNFINTNEDYILITNGINNNLDWYDKSEFIGKFVYCKLLHDNTKNKEIKLTNIDYNTKIFYR